MIFLHLTIVMIGLLLGYVFRKEVLGFLISSVLLSGIYAYAVLSILAIPDQTFEFIVRAIVIATSSVSFTFFLTRGKALVSFLSIVLILLSTFFEEVSEFAQDHTDSISLYFTAPVAIEESDTMLVYHYRFKKDEIIRIPENLKQCHQFIDTLLKVKEHGTHSNSAAEMHFGLGMWIRNNWGLWSGKSNLSKNLRLLGIEHPDNMSGFILDTYMIRRKLLWEKKFNDSLFYTNTLDSTVLAYRERH